MAEKTEKKSDPFDLASGVPGIEGELRPKPKLSDRISKRVIAVAMLFVGIVALIFLLALDSMDKPKVAAEKPPVKRSANDVNANPPAELVGSPSSPGTPDDAGAKPSSLVKWPTFTSASGIPAASTARSVVPAISFGGPPGGGASTGRIPTSSELNSKIDAPQSPEQRAKEQEQASRASRLAQAKSNGLSVSGFSAGGGGGIAPVAPSTNMEALRAALQTSAAGGQGGGQQKPAGDSEQDEKLDFLKSATKEDRGYHPHIARPALSPNEVKAGTPMQLVLEQGINSDLPGQVTARVTEDVYDTVTGCRLLIPAMAKVIGKYDSKVALGQGRNLVVWNLMIFGDGSELNLAGMQAYDRSGMAGIDAEVDNHYLRLFGLTFGMSILTAGVQMSVPPPPPQSVNGVATQPSFQQSLAAALAQQYGQLGSQMLGKYMAVQPTLRNYPGERFMIMVPHTIVFNKVWRARCVMGNKEKG